MYPWLSTAVFAVLLALLVYHATSSGTAETTWNLTVSQELEIR